MPALYQQYRLPRHANVLLAAGFCSRLRRRFAELTISGAVPPRDFH
jgi:hypothetical protein